MWCIKKQKIKNKFNEIISIRSQLHQPPQLNSCSAHQAPKNIEIRNKNIVNKNSFFFTFKKYE